MVARECLLALLGVLVSAGCKPVQGGDETTGETGTGGATDGHSEGGGVITSSGGALDGTSDGGETSGSSGGSSSGGVSPSTSTTTDPPDPTGGDPECEENLGSLVHKPAGPLVAIEEDTSGSIVGQVGAFGGVKLTASRAVDVDAWTFSASAGFVDVTVAQRSFVCGVEVDVPEGLEDCGLRYFGGFGWGSGEFVARGAGAVTLVGPDWSEAMVPLNPPNFDYSVDLGELGHAPGFGAVHGLQWTGDEVAAGDLPGLVVMPPMLELLAPGDVPVVLGDGDLELAWTGASAQPLVLRATFTEDPLGGSEWFELSCAMADDGAFVVPGSLLAQIPGGWSSQGTLVRSSVTTMASGERTIVGEGRVVVDVELVVAP